MKTRTAYIFPSLHILNLPFAILLKLFGNVYVFKFHGLCQKLLNRKLFLSLPDFKDVDTWKKTQESVFLKLKSSFQPKKTAHFNFKINDYIYESEFLFLQNFFKDYEQYIFLITLGQSVTQKPKFIGTAFIHYLHTHHPDLSETVQIFNGPFLFLDRFYLYLQNWIMQLKLIVKLFYTSTGSFVFRPYKYIFTGISAAEHPTSDSSLNFAWPIVNNLITPEECLFVIDRPPSSEAQSILNKNSTHYVTRIQLLSSLKLIEKIELILNGFKLLFQFHNFYFMNFSYQCQSHNQIWYRLFKKIQPKYFIFSFSAGWPELYEVAIANQLNIKTINWFYGTSEFGYTQHTNPFRDLNIRFCIRACRELWIWNPLLQKLIESRTFLPCKNKIKIVGPILNGNFNHLTTQESKSDSKLFKISVFDISPKNVHSRLQDGEGPYCNFEMQERIYQSILNIYERFPNIQIVIKTKRKENPNIFETPPSLTRLQNIKSDRLQLLPFNTDPYLAIQGSDLVISTPYTSPSILANMIGLNGVFYDPIGIAHHTYQEAFKDLTVHTEDELYSLIQKLMINKSHQTISEFFKPMTLLQIKQNIKELLN